MLSMYCEAASGNSIWYSLVRFVLLWHFAHVAGRFSLYTGLSGLFTGRISCDPWQSQHCAAPEAPIEWLIPWMLVSYSFCSLSWHPPQFGAGILPCTSSLIPSWQSTQSSALCTDAAKPFVGNSASGAECPFTIRLFAGSVWQSRQSELANLGAALVAGEAAETAGRLPISTADKISRKTDSLFDW